MIEPINGQTEKNNGTSNTINDVDWPGLRAAAVAIGIRKAARQAARDLPPDERERFVQLVSLVVPARIGLNNAR